MPGINDEIHDLQVRHQVGIQRLGSSIVQRVIPLLNRSDQEIVEKLLSRDATLQGTFTSKRLKSLLAAIREINRDAHVALGRELRKALRELSKYEASFQKRLLEETLPVRLDVVSPSAETLNAVVTARPFNGRFLREWISGLSSASRARVRDAIRLGMVQGEATSEIVRRIRGTRALRFRDGVMEISRRSAEAMVRTAVTHTATVAREEFYKQNSDIISKVQWVATLDTRTCVICQGLDGKTFPAEEGPRPPAHINCRCTSIPVVKSWRELGINADELDAGTRASLNGQVAATQSYGEWLRKQSAEVQNDALGPTRARLFRKGGLSVDRFSNRAGDALTLDELRLKESSAFERAGLAA